jgi:TonB-linked SusC/RagA family outer membrane protein
MFKWIFFFVFVLCMKVSATGYSQNARVSLDVKKMDFRKVLNLLEKKGNIHFLYSNELLPDKEISLTVKDESVVEILRKLLSNTGFKYKVINEELVVIAPEGTDIKNNKIKGRVIDESGKPLAGVSVIVEGTKSGTTTNEEGEFEITVPEKATLVISYVGYFSQTVSTEGKTKINLTLKIDPATAALNDVVVIGYGKQKKVTMTGSVGTVTGKDLVQTPVENVTNMMVGRFSGVSAVQASGEPGQNSATIHIRGLATLNGADPLIVIDGIQQPAEQPYVVLDQIDANEIDNISILKDASATAVYGIRGANGVIIVTTKRGKLNAPQLSFSARGGTTKATSLLQTLDSYQYALFRNEGVQNAQTFGDHSFDQLLFTDEDLWKFKNDRDYTPAEVAGMTKLTAAQQQQLNNSPALYYTSHNFYKDQFDGTGKQQQYNLNITGGSQKVKYFSSLGYYDQTGIFANTNYGGVQTNSDFKRYNFRSNFDLDVIKNFQVSINIGGESSVFTGPSSGYNGGDLGNRYQNIIQNILENSPFSGPGIVNGHLVTSFVGNPGDSLTNPLGLKGGTGYSPDAQFLTASVLSQYVTTLTSSIIIKHNMGYITKGLNAHFTISYDDSYTKGYTKNNSGSIPQYSAMRDPSDPLNIIFLGGQLSPVSTADNQWNASWRKVYLEAAIDYNRTFGGHTVSGLILGNAQKYTASGQSYNTPSGLMGLVGRVTYNFRERYLLEFDMGVNGTENFAPGKRFGYFPAVSGGWVVSKEPFFPKNDWVTWLKLTGSYGEVGNDQLSANGTTRRYLYLPSTWAYSGVGATNGYWFGNSNGSSANSTYSGAYESALGNPNVTWERAKKTNASIETRFLNNRLSATGTLFWENRNNILVTLQTIPGTYGVAAANIPPANVGRVTNHGYEIELGWNDVIGKLNYFIKTNWSFARNKIVYEAEPSYPYPWMNQTGYSIGQYKGLVTDGFYNTQAELNNRPYNSFGNYARLGDLRYKDINGDGIINQDDEVPIGYPNVPEIAYNLSLGFSYKGFDVSALFIGTAKGSFPQSGYELSTPFAKNVGAVLQYAYDGHWTAEKYASGQKITYPEFSFDGGGPNNQFSDFWLKSNDFKRLKNLEVGYSLLGTKVLRGTNIQRIRIYANGNNLITWGSHLLKGIDPELADAGKSSYGYIFPLTKTFNVGVNIQF